MTKVKVAVDSLQGAQSSLSEYILFLVILMSHITKCNYRLTIVCMCVCVCVFVFVQASFPMHVLTSYHKN